MCKKNYTHLTDVWMEIKKKKKPVAGSPQESQNTALISNFCILASFIASYILFQLQFLQLFLSRSTFFELQHLRRCFNSSSSPQQANYHCPWRLFLWKCWFCLGQWLQEHAGVPCKRAWSIQCCCIDKTSWLLRTWRRNLCKIVPGGK